MTKGEAGFAQNTTRVRISAHFNCGRHARLVGSGSQQVEAIGMKRWRELSWKQRYYLFLIWYFRVFGAVFAAAAPLIALSNFSAPPDRRTGDLTLIGVMGVGFCIVGCAIYMGATRILHWYRQRLGAS
jgi:hypothetical protein